MNNRTFLTNQSTSDYSAHPDILVIINCVLNAPLMLASIIGNNLVLTAILRTPSLRSPSMILLCSLALSDLLVGLVVQPFYIANELEELDKLQVSGIGYFITYSSCGVSLCTMTAISMDRFAALHYHMRYVTIVTTTRVVCALVLEWVIISLTFVIYIWNNFIYLTFASISIVNCLLISSYCYIRIYQIVKRHQLQIQAQHQAMQSSHVSNNLNILRLKKSSMNTFVYYIFLILCYSPMFTVLMLSGIFHMKWTKTWNFCSTVVFMNSAINPFLYCWRTTELRSAVVKTARKMFCTQADQE